jgi:hypothetical protein
MTDAISGVLAAPVATLFVVGGLIFLLIAVIGNISGKIEPGPKGRLGSAVLGVALLVGGLGLHFRESGRAATSRETGQAAPTETPVHPQAEPATAARSITPADADQRQPAPTPASVGAASSPSGSGSAEREPNNQVPQANVIAFGTAALGKIASTADRDVYKFVAAADTTRVILRKRSPQGFSGQIDVYDDVERSLVSQLTYGDEPATVSLETVLGATYYVIVKSVYGGGEYELVVRTE